MVQTRGKRTLAFTHGGGVRREIGPEVVSEALRQCDLPVEQCVHSLATFLDDRLAHVDVSPKVIRGAEKELERIEKAAESLISAMSAFPHMSDLKLSIAADMCQHIGYMENGLNLYRWLLRLSRARELYFEEHNPTRDYRRAISRIYSIIQEAGGNVAIHGNSKFVRLLIAFEDARPAMIFPPESVSTGRVRYIENALQTYPPNQTQE